MRASVVARGHVEATSSSCDTIYFPRTELFSRRMCPNGAGLASRRALEPGGFTIMRLSFSMTAHQQNAIGRAALPASVIDRDSRPDSM